MYHKLPCITDANSGCSLTVQQHPLEDNTQGLIKKRVSYSYGVTRDRVPSLKTRCNPHHGALGIKARYMTTFHRQLNPRAFGVALYDWDGNMRHHSICGLPLTNGQPVNIYNLAHKDWFYGWNPVTDRWGKFPRIYVHVTEILDEYLRKELEEPWEGAIPFLTEESPSVTEGSHDPRHPGLPGPSNNIMVNNSVPTLPFFPYPQPSPQSFTIPLGEHGFSSIQAEVSFQPLQVPAERVYVNVALQCIAAHPRRISSVMISLVFPDNDVRDLYPTDYIGPETTVDVEMADHTKVELGAGVAWQGISVGAKWKHGIGEVESTTRVTQRTVKGFVKNVNTAFWLFEEDVGQKNGLPVHARMGFSLGYKPDRGFFQCRVTSVKHEKEKEIYRSQRYCASGKRSLKETLSKFIRL